MGEIKRKYAIDSNMLCSTRGFGIISTASLYGNLYLFSNMLKTVIYSVLTDGLLFFDFLIGGLLMVMFSTHYTRLLPTVCLLFSPA